MKTIYLDNAATTPLSTIAFEAMQPYLIDKFYNPSANYEQAVQVKNIIEECRMNIASTIGADKSEIYFTSGGTESDNWALRFAQPGQHIITSRIEHHAILNTCKWLETQGVEVTYLDVGADGLVNIKDLQSAIKNNTVLVSIMMANNEIGSIQPIADLAEIAAYNNVLFHTDAVQAYGHIPIDVNDFGIDMMSVSSHKFNGPKGIGFLYVSNRVPLMTMIFGGEQQSGKRAGTYNVPGIVGMSKAAELATNKTTMKKYNDTVEDLSRYMCNRIIKEIPYTRLNGGMTHRLANNINVLFDGIQGEQLLTVLSMRGVCASSGSACNSSLNEPSHVLKAIGLSDDEANSSIRFTLSIDNTREEIDYTVDVLKECVDTLRSISTED